MFGEKYEEMGDRDEKEVSSTSFVFSINVAPPSLWKLIELMTPEIIKSVRDIASPVFC